MAFDKSKKEGKPMIDIFLLLGILKWLWLGFEIVHYFEFRKREKTLEETLNSYNQRLNTLEKSVRELTP
jgi:biopolymer transport protein ExbB/TolQ